MSQHNDVDLVIVAAGKGERLGFDVPKALVPLLGRRLIDWTLDRLLPMNQWASVTIVSPQAGFTADHCHIVEGGSSRAASVQNGLQPGTAPYVIIHDAARMFPDHEAVQNLIRTLKEGAQSASLASPVRDSLIRGSGAAVDRRDLWSLQTPQGFERALLEQAFAGMKDRDLTDETALIKDFAGLSPTLIPAPADNFKITYPEDLRMAETILLAKHNDIRVGTGYDVHAFEKGDHVTLGGVKIPHNKGIKAHSDGDVLFHALADALYGTCADHDIGHHFPPNKSETANMDSRRIVEAARNTVLVRGGVIAHADVMVLSEAPKLSPHRDTIRASIADALQIDMNRVSVKATTMEKLGFIGREEGLAAQATVTVRF